jgi:hypothetical protein
MKHSNQIRLSLHSMSKVTDPLFISFSLNTDNRIGNYDNQKRIRECIGQNAEVVERYS